MIGQLLGEFEIAGPARHNGADGMTNAMKDHLHTS
jgi:hypothetical protein